MSNKRPVGTLAGRIAYSLYHRPRRVFASLLSRGLLNSWEDERSRRKMVDAAWGLPTPSIDHALPSADVYFLTGEKYFYQTAFCAWTLAQHSSCLTPRPIIYDDGTLSAEHHRLFSRLFPDSQIVTQSASEAHLDKHLPRNRFPKLREHRDIKPHLLKLCDIYSGTSDSRLFLDSDMLFFREPTFLLEWLLSPRGSCYMVDVFTAYGYPIETLESLTGAPIPEKINIGVMGLDASQIDWDRVEAWISLLLNKHGAHYNITQALCAMLMSTQPPALAAPKEDYVVLPPESACRHPTEIMQHYVAESKIGYFRHAWKNTLKSNRLKTPLDALM